MEVKFQWTNQIDKRSFSVIRNTLCTLPTNERQHDKNHIHRIFIDVLVFDWLVCVNVISCIWYVAELYIRWYEPSPLIIMYFIYIPIALVKVSILDFKIQNSFSINETKYYFHFKTTEHRIRWCLSVNDFSMSMTYQCQCWFLNN